MNTKKLTAEQSQRLIRHALTMAQKVCHERFCDPHPMGQVEVCKATAEAIDLLDHYDTTARKEARAAAFKDAVKWAKKVESVKRNAARDASADDEFAAIRLAHEADGANRVVETLEAAAHRAEGDGDG